LRLLGSLRRVLLLSHAFFLDVVLFVLRVCVFLLCQGVVLAALKGCPVQFESVSCLALRSDSEVVAAAGVQHDLGSFTY